MGGRTFQPGVAEGQSTTRPPLFDGTNYAYWKERMRIFIQSNDYDSWMVIKHGETVPTKIVDGVLVPKLETEYTSNDKKKMQLNARAVNFLYCAVNPDDYRKISRCKTANEMWNKLEVTYEGTSQVKNSKINLLTHEYELFMMMENETIDGMFERFSTIVSNLDTLGKHYEDHVLQSTPCWVNYLVAVCFLTLLSTVDAEVEVDETIGSTDQIPPFNVADSDDEDPIPRPIGRKKAKSIASGSGGSASVSASPRDEIGRAMVEQLRAFNLQEQERLKLKEKELKIKEQEAEMKVMQTDPGTLSEFGLMIYEQRMREIKEKYNLP
ncbi:unnamed protein product [Cuscuta campestris]|uniref:No apical meristem-associated C-terminal domain-containing protein n=1 Tax=Cuscuta campestris TaxID=132261 RepID=A0A484LY16_9ASTE|nr:unnamed protein product [Cuscuta campestris]